MDIFTAQELRTQLKETRLLPKTYERGLQIQRLTAALEQRTQLQLVEGTTMFATIRDKAVSLATDAKTTALETIATMTDGNAEFQAVARETLLQNSRGVSMDELTSKDWATWLKSQK